MGEMARCCAYAVCCFVFSSRVVVLLPFGHGVSLRGEVWDACAARGKVGPVMGLRPSFILMPNHALRV